MSTLKRTFKHRGQTIPFEITDMTPDEHDDYCLLLHQRLGDEPAISKFQAAEFDKRCVSCGIPKESISKTEKSRIMFQLFENSFVSEEETKN